MVTKARKSRTQATVYEEHNWDGLHLTFALDDEKNLNRVRMSAGLNEKLVENFLTRKDIVTDFSSVKTTEDGETLKKDFMKTYEVPSGEELKQSIDAYLQTNNEKLQLYMAYDAMRQLTFDFASASKNKVSDERYADIVEYAKNMLSAVIENKSLEAVKEPRRSAIARLGDRIFGRDALHHTREWLTDEKESEYFPTKDMWERIKANIPSERMVSADISSDKGIVAEKFAKCFDEQENTAVKKEHNAYKTLCENILKVKIKEGAESTFDERLKQHLQKIKIAELKQKKEEDKAKNDAMNKTKGKIKQREVQMYGGADPVGRSIAKIKQKIR